MDEFLRRALKTAKAWRLSTAARSGKTSILFLQREINLTSSIISFDLSAAQPREYKLIRADFCYFKQIFAVMERMEKLESGSLPL